MLHNGITTDTNNREIKVINKQKNKRGIINIILQLDLESYSMLKAKEALNRGWKVSYYCDYVRLMKCYECFKFEFESNRSVQE